MPGLQVWNDQILIQMFRHAGLAFRLMPDGEFHAGFDLQEGSVEVAGTISVSGLLYYAMPCLFESLVVRVEGIAAPLVNRVSASGPRRLMMTTWRLIPTYTTWKSARRACRGGSNAGTPSLVPISSSIANSTSNGPNYSRAAKTGRGSLCNCGKRWTCPLGLRIQRWPRLI